MKKHELMLIASTDLTGEERKQLLESIKAELGEIVHQEEWGVRDLAYPMKKQSKGYYTVYNFLGGIIHEIDEHLRLNPMVLRHLIISVPSDYSPVTLSEIEQSAETLLAKKAREREVRHGGGRKKPQEEEPKKDTVRPGPAEPKQPEKEPERPVQKTVEELQPAEKTEPAIPASEPPKESPREEKKGSSLDDLDKKLDKIFKEDDIDLGF